MQVLDIAPSDATKAFCRALEEKMKRVELKLTEKDQWNKEDPVIFICNNSSRIKSDISPIINFIGDKTSKILLVIFHCKTLERLPLISLKEELKTTLPANIEIIEMGFDIHSKSNSIYKCDLNTKSCRRIEDYASENNVNFKDNNISGIWYSGVEKCTVWWTKVWSKKKKLTDKNVNDIELKSVMESKDTNLDTLLTYNDDNINKRTADLSAKDVHDDLRGDMTAKIDMNHQAEVEEVKSTIEKPLDDMLAKETSIREQHTETLENEKQHADTPAQDFTNTQEHTAATDVSIKRQRVDEQTNDDTIEKQPESTCKYPCFSFQ